jgi:hypothetical protein
MEKLKTQNVVASSDKKHIGTIGEKINLELKLVMMTGYVTQFGNVGVYIFNDKEGNTIIWKSSNNFYDFNDIEKYYSVVAKVKKHSYYKGNPETIVTHLKKILK